MASADFEAPSLPVCSCVFFIFVISLYLINYIELAIADVGDSYFLFSFSITSSWI